MPYISELSIYPLKSATGVSVKELTLTSRGPSFDRHWMVVNSNNRFITQRQKSSMCLITTQLVENTLVLNAPAMKELIVEQNQQTRCVEVWDDQVEAYDCGEQAATWISNYLGIDCRLVSMPDDCKRLVDPHYAKQQETVSFADGFPSLIISQASLDDFNTKLEAPITMQHFRPNIVIDDCPPFAEDQWQAINVNDITLSLVKPCSRCIIPAIDPTTGKKRMDILQALNTHRRRDNATYFGQNALHDKPGVIRVGDKVEVIALT